MDRIPTSKFYELIKARIQEIENEIKQTSSEPVKRHLEKSLERNRQILNGLLKSESHADKYH